MRRFDADALGRVLAEDFGLVDAGAAGDTVTTVATVTAVAKFAVAFSGGRDSTVLLHALAALRARHRFELRALHFDHGIAAESATWAAHCAAQCRAWGVDFAARRESLAKPPGASLEAHARRRRYGWFAAAAQPGETLLTAHHADDQAETVLLNLLRGGGPESLAGIRPRRALAAGAAGAQVARPLLAFPAAALADYARAHGLRWVDDPSNDSLAFDRNYVRATVLPALRRRWHGAAGALNLSAAHCRAAAELLAEDDARAFDACRADTKRGVLCLAPPLAIEAMRGLGRARALRLIRHWIHRHGLRSPSAGQLAELFAQVFESRAAAAVLRWDGVEIRRFRDGLYLIGPPGDPPPAPVDWDLRAHDFGNGLRVEVGDGDGAGGDAAVAVTDTVVAAIDPRALAGRRVQWAWRRGGERMTLPGRAHSHALKKLLQQTAAPPWERRALPHLTVDGEIAWVHTVGPAAGCACSDAAGIVPRFVSTVVAA